MSRLDVVSSSAFSSNPMYLAHTAADFLAFWYASEIARISVSLSGSFIDPLDCDLAPVGIHVFKVLERRRIPTMPPAQGANGREVGIPSNQKSVGDWFHCVNIPIARYLGKVARTTKGKTRFPFRVVLVPRDRPSPRPPWIGTHQWKHRAIYSMKMKLSIQIEKASNRAKWQWYKFYSVRGYGAPGRLEFICPYSGMVAKTIQQEEAVSFRRYWANCAIKSQQILDWLESLDPSRYTAELNSYLLKCIIALYGIRETKKYESKNPFVKLKSWQKM